jgi:hypothetical protein
MYRGFAALFMAASVVPSAAGCLDLRDFEGTWAGDRVGEAPELRVGMTDDASATLVIEEADLRSLRARLTVDNDVIDNALIQPIPGTQADVLAGITFDGAPSRVYLAFCETTDGGGDAMIFVALYNDERVEVRVLRGGSQPLYGIFVLERTA